MAANFISIEQFNIVRVIGKGSFGQVFEALKELKSYAVKCIKLPEDDAEMAHSSLKEINEMRTLHHPNIVSYHAGWWEFLPPEWQTDYLNSKSATSSSKSNESEVFFRDFQSSIEAEDNSNNFSISSLSDQLTMSSINDDSSRDCIQFSQPSHKSCNSSRDENDSDIIFSSGNEESNYSADPIAAGKRSKNYIYLYIQMELCRKENLTDWLKTRQPEYLDVDEMFREILLAVEYLHEQNLVHRDLKPGNIFFDFNWSVKVGDFGLSKRMAMNESPISASRNHIGKEKELDTFNRESSNTVYVGTKPYMAPEQETSTMYNHKVDIYALGVILFELKMGPFDTDSERADLIFKLKFFQFPPKFNDDNTKQLLTKMLSVDPSKRPEVKDIISEQFLNLRQLSTRTQGDTNFFPFLFITLGYSYPFNIDVIMTLPKCYKNSGSIFTRKKKGYFKHWYRASPKETDERVIENRSQQSVLRKSLHKSLWFPSHRKANNRKLKGSSRRHNIIHQPQRRTGNRGRNF